MAQPGTPPTPSDGQLIVYSAAYGGVLVVPGASLDASGNASVASCNAASTETTRAEAAEALLSPKASPTFTGTVTLPSGTALVAPVLGTPASGTLTNCTFPTLNQNTTGTAGGLSGTPAITVGAVTCTSVTGSDVCRQRRCGAIRSDVHEKRRRGGGYTNGEHHNHSD